MKKKVLFICTHNSARSQMAEGLMNHYYGGRWEAFSAGTEATEVRPQAVKALAELDIDISHHRSKKIDEFKEVTFDYVVTVCDSAKETCPFFPGAGVLLHKSFEDPSAAQGTEDEKLRVFRRVRDEIKSWIEKDLV